MRPKELDQAVQTAAATIPTEELRSIVDVLFTIQQALILELSRRDV